MIFWYRLSLFISNFLILCWHTFSPKCKEWKNDRRLAWSLNSLFPRKINAAGMKKKRRTMREWETVHVQCTARSSLMSNVSLLIKHTYTLCFIVVDYSKYRWSGTLKKETTRWIMSKKLMINFLCRFLKKHSFFPML